MSTGRRTYGIVGHPVAHSLSPVMHRAAFREVGIDAEYVPFDVPPAELARSVAALKRVPVHGLNVTAPHKEAILPLLDEVSDEARELDAVNTVVVRDGVWRGENTDASGLADALEVLGTVRRGGAAVILGAGGAARAALRALSTLGIERVHVANRTVFRATRLVRSAAAHGLAVEASGLDSDLLRGALGAASLLVQATPAGMEGVDARGWPDVVPLDALPADAGVVDLVYHPAPSELLRRATARGLATLDGLAMLLGQGARAFELWTGRPAPVDAMRRALAERTST